MEVELFNVSCTKDSPVNINLNQNVINAYGKTLEEIEEKFDSEKLSECIQQFLDILHDKI